MAIREVLSYNCPVTPTQAQLLMASFSSDPGRRAFAQALSRLWQRLEIRQAKWEGTIRNHIRNHLADDIQSALLETLNSLSLSFLIFTLFRSSQCWGSVGVSLVRRV